MSSTWNVQIGLADIASMAGVTPSAVSNWRKRYDDFPLAQADATVGFLFDFNEVQEWLLEKGKIEVPVPAAMLLWQFVDSLRGWWTPDQSTDFVVSALVYLEACDLAVNPSSGITIAQSNQWSSLKAAGDDELSAALESAADSIERENELLRGLVLRGFVQPPMPPGQSLRRILDALESSSREEHSLVPSFEDALARRGRMDRFAGERSTPDDLSYLIANLIPDDAVSVFDPAVGVGGLLLLAAQVAQQSDRSLKVTGYETNEATLREARSRFFIYGEPLEWKHTDSLRDPSIDSIGADAVVLDAPMGMKAWGDAELYLDPRWKFGAPPANNADFAWLQIALRALHEGGTAIVVLSRSSLFSSGKQRMIRETMLRQGVIEAIIALPAKLRRETSAQMALWIVRASGGRLQPDSPVLFVDATNLGTRGKVETTLEEEDVRAIASIVRKWRLTREAARNGRVPTRSLRASEIVNADLWQPFVKAEYLSRPSREELMAAAASLRIQVGEALTASLASTERLMERIGRTQ